MLNFKETTVPEGLEAHYESTTDGSFQLKVEGLPEVKDNTEEITQLKADNTGLKVKVDEFRTSNITLKQQLEKDVGSDTKIETLIQDAIAPFRQAQSDLESKNKLLNTQYEEVVLSDKVKSLAIEAGVDEHAVTDVVVRAKSAFSVKDGKVLPTDANARDKEGNLFTLESWMKNLSTSDSAAHLFKASQGSGAFRSKNTGQTNTNRSSVDRISSGLAAK